MMPGNELPHLVTPLPGEQSRALIELLAASETPSFTARRARREHEAGIPQDPVVWAQATGCNVVDADGNRFVDLTSGFGAALVGHCHPDVVASIRAQAEELVHALGESASIHHQDSTAGAPSRSSRRLTTHESHWLYRAQTQSRLR